VIGCLIRCHFSVLWPFGIPQTNWYGRWAVKPSELYWIGPSIWPSVHSRCAVPPVTCARPIKRVFRLAYHLTGCSGWHIFCTLTYTSATTWPCTSCSCWSGYMHGGLLPTLLPEGVLYKSYGWCRVNLIYNLLSFQPLTMQLVSNPKVNLSESLSFQLVCNQGNHPLVKTGQR